MKRQIEKQIIRERDSERDELQRANKRRRES